jgi:hypothetical protein
MSGSKGARLKFHGYKILIAACEQNFQMRGGNADLGATNLGYLLGITASASLFLLNTQTSDANRIAGTQIHSSSLWSTVYPRSLKKRVIEIGEWRKVLGTRNRCPKQGTRQHHHHKTRRPSNNVRKS